jgi:anti-sigma B factor antagonist
MPDGDATPILTVDVEQHADDLAIVRCHGKLVAGVTDVLYARVNDLIPETQQIVLDLSGLKHTDSMGLGMLVRLYVSAKSAGCSLELLNLSQQIRHLLGITNMLSVFTVIGDKGAEFG